MRTPSLLSYRYWNSALMMIVVATLGSLSLSGCERKEKVIDIETPGADVEVERNIDTGEVDVQATEK